MKIAVMGTGGVGGLFGGKLARAGEDVTFIARGEHLNAVRARGLRIKSQQEGEFVVSSAATDRPKDVGPVDLVLFCVKSYDTEAAAEAIRPMVSRNTAVLSLQNGVDNEEKIAGIIGPGHTLGGVAYVFASIESPGVITYGHGGRIVFGELDGQESERTQDLLQSFSKVGIAAERSTNIRRVLWEKYLFITALSGMTALTRCPIGVIRLLPETRTMHRRLLEELADLAKASGVELSPDVVEQSVSVADNLPATSYSSLHYDLMHGRRLELDALQGYAVRLGKRLRVSTPTLFAVYAALKPFEDGLSSPAS
jgi:2-dehydropantoate 2-reductase